MNAREARSSSSARRLRDSLEPLAVQGFLASRPAFEALGLSRPSGYVWSRAAAMGEPSPAVVVAAFGVFEPAFVADAYDLGRATLGRSDVLATLSRCAETRLVEVLGDDPDIGILADALLDSVTGLSGAARPLFAALRDLRVPEAPHGRLWRAADLMREHRGDGHLAANIAAGMTPIEMNVLTELWVGYRLREYSPTRRHSAEAIDETIAVLRGKGWLDDDVLSADGANLRDGIEAATDASQGELLEAIGGRADWIIETASRFADRVIAANAFTSDVRKRAAG